jgi:hypothetical protein
VYLPGDNDVVLSRDVVFLNEYVSVRDNSNVLEDDNIVIDAEYSADIQFDNQVEDVVGNLQNDADLQAENVAVPHNGRILRDR